MKRLADRRVRLQLKAGEGGVGAVKVRDAIQLAGSGDTSAPVTPSELVKRKLGGVAWTGGHNTSDFRVLG